jgi:hypothetical protein
VPQEARMHSPLLDALEAEQAAREPGYRGFRGRHRIEADPAGEFAGLFIEVDDMTVGEQLALVRNSYFFDLYRLMAPLVLDWNVEVPTFEEAVVPAECTEGGFAVEERTVVRQAGWERLAPPAQAGPDAFVRLSESQPETVDWIIARLRGFPQAPGEMAKKALRLLAATPSGTRGGRPRPASAAPSPTPSPPAPPSSSRRSRSTSPRPAPPNG